MVLVAKLSPRICGHTFGKCTADSIEIWNIFGNVTHGMQMLNQKAVQKSQYSVRGGPTF